MTTRTLLPHQGLSTGIGYYVSGMEEVREQVCKTIEGLSAEDIGRVPFLGANPLGALVLHIGEAEWWWMQCVVSGRQLTEQDKHAPFWDVLNDPIGFQNKGYTAEFCIAEIQKIRNQTRDLLFTRSDKDLEQIITFERHGKKTEYSLRWILHHLIDHEAQHKGQILMLRRLMEIYND